MEQKMTELPGISSIMTMENPFLDFFDALGAYLWFMGIVLLCAVALGVILRKSPRARTCVFLIAIVLVIFRSLSGVGEMNEFLSMYTETNMAFDPWIAVNLAHEFWWKVSSMACSLVILVPLVFYSSYQAGKSRKSINS